ncbi:MAG: hypothetical protein EXQ70_01525 [Solirubrobacterales bacterium]|nr:hypothetical protein [Solirubrobacterales bacterium]
MATVAVFLALTGGAIAATKIGKNSVGATQLKKNAVVTAKLKDKAVVTAKIGDGAVTAAKANLASLGIIHSGRKLLNPVDGSGLAGALTVNLFNSGGAACGGHLPGQRRRQDRHRQGDGQQRGQGSGYSQTFIGDPVNLSSTLSGAPAQLAFHNSSGPDTIRLVADFVVDGGPAISLDIFAAVNIQSADCVLSANGIGV